jgi:hypothetical protein
MIALQSGCHDLALLLAAADLASDHRVHRPTLVGDGRVLVMAGDTYLVERSITIDVPPESIHKNLADFRLKAFAGESAKS